MKMRWMAVAVLALMASACGGVVEDASTDTQAVDTVSAAGLGSENEIGGGGPCGSNYCGKGTFCCNASCGICAPLGGGCPDVMCEVAQPEETHEASAKQAPEESLATTCGGRVCAAGTYCCNASCGICAPKGASCTQQVC
jgi:hypothetical protein